MAMSWIDSVDKEWWDNVDVGAEYAKNHQEILDTLAEWHEMWNWAGAALICPDTALNWLYQFYTI